MSHEEIDETLQQALALGEEGEWARMVEVLTAALEEDSEDPYLHCWLGVAERELGLDGLAYDHFKTCLALEPEDPQLLITAGAGVATFDDPDAEAALRSAALIAPELPLARWMYGAYLSREGQIESALVELLAAYTLSPEESVISYEIGVAHALSSDWGRAAEALERAVELDREDGWLRGVEGLILLEMDSVEKAAEALIEAARLRPEDVELQFLSALGAAALGWEDVSYEMLERGRQHGLETDLQMSDVVEEGVVEGGDRALDLLKGQFGPAILHDRLIARP